MPIGRNGPISLAALRLVTQTTGPERGGARMLWRMRAMRRNWNSREKGWALRAVAWAGVVLCLVATHVSGPASAAAGRWNSQEIVADTFADARLVAAVDGVGALDAIPAGFHLRIPDGWKTYWRSPGDAGLPPRIDWSASQNVADVAFAWPAPNRFTLFGIDTFGYDGEIVFPLSVSPERAGAPVSLRGRADVLVCSDICVPLTFQVGLDIGAGPAVTDGDAANLIDRFASRVPDDGAISGIRIDSVGVMQPGEAPRLQIVAFGREPFETPDVFLEAGDFYAFGAPSLETTDGGHRLVATLDVLQQPSGAPPMADLPVTVTLVDGSRAVETSSTVAGTTAEPGTGSETGAQAVIGGGPAVDTAVDRSADRTADVGAGNDALTWVVILASALLGGLILNLMPCVLPVLSLKLLAVVSHGGASSREIRIGFLASAAGILTSFAVLAAGAIAMKAAGASVGWGIQFQQPLFLVLMIVVLTLFACNLFGLFEIILPGAIADRAAGHGPREGPLGHFATGAFATLLATPCSAPFLGTAIGFALSQGPAEIAIVFLALGIGLALPYLLVAAVPAMARRLPRPGRWMITVRRIMGLALLATALWLLTVLSVQATATASIAVAATMAGIGLLLAARRSAGRGLRALGGVGIAAMIVISFLLPGYLEPSASAAGAGAGSDAAIGPVADDPATEAGTPWLPFERGDLVARIGEGRIVFVDVTADWCLTCQVNKALVLDRGDVAEALSGGGLVPMRADWTLPDQEIADFLAEHGRYGIPFYAVYGPQAPDGIALPEILTEDLVLEALREAGWTSAVGDTT